MNYINMLNKNLLLEDAQEDEMSQRHPPRQAAPEHDTSRHILTIKQASTLFAHHGVPRSIRTVQRFCDVGHLDCVRINTDKGESYFIDPLSIERYAEELKQLKNISSLGVDASRHDATERDTPRYDTTREMPSPILRSAIESDDEIEALRTRVKTLKKLNLQLTIDRSAKEQVIAQMVDERQAWHEQLIAQSREIGRLEEQLLQLAAPKRDATRHDATDHDMTRSVETVSVMRDETIVEPQLMAVTSDVPLNSQSDEPLMSSMRPVRRKIFGIF